MKTLPVVLLTSLLALSALANAEHAEAAVELGTVAWGRDLAAARKASADSGKPVFILFQEVPGCIGCQNFGQQVLSQPLLKEAVETEFIPVLVYNNRGGDDKALLKQYSEPAWNYPVVRFVDSNGKDLISRQDQIFTLDGIVSRMVSALTAAKRPIPNYLLAIAPPKAGKGLQEAAFSMACFWTGEAKLGSIPGVMTTEAGWLDRHEVTRIQYDPTQISFADLLSTAKANSCANGCYVQTLEQQSAAKAAALPTGTLKGYTPAKASDQKYQINRIDLSRVANLTPTQLTKLNSLLASDRQAALSWLSPTQQQSLLAVLAKTR